MNARTTENMSWAAPVALLLFLVQVPRGSVYVTATLAAVMAVVVVIQLGARCIWTPVLKKGGLRGATWLLGCAMIAGLVTTLLAGAMKLGDPSGFTWNLVSRAAIAAIAALLCSWVLAASRGAQENEPNPMLQPTTPSGPS